MNRPTAVVRRDIMASTGPSIYGINRLDRVRSPAGEEFTFLGVAEGIAHLERIDKTRGEAFVEVESDVFGKWKKV